MHPALTQKTAFRHLAESFSAVGQLVLDERSRWSLWFPVGLGTGIAIYFALPFEPVLWLGPILALALLVSSALLQNRPELFIAMLAVLSISTGFAAAQIRTALIASPMLAREIGPLRIEATLVGTEALADGHRLLLRNLSISRLEPAETPTGARVRWLGKGELPPPGSRIALRAALAPPADPAEPGAFDFRRHAFFEGIGAVGYAVSAPEVIALPEDSFSTDVAGMLESTRQTVAERIRAVVPQPARGIVHALMTGEQTAIPPDVVEAMRVSGLSHLLSISGLHIGMVSGFVFFLVRALLALIEPVALRWPIKKWAAVIAILAASGYTLLVQAPVPAQRAALMTGLVLFAVLVDRSAVSMRVLAFAASGILLLAPESLLGVSFQMSFAAVLALIAAYEVIRPYTTRWRQETGWLGHSALYLGGIAFSSLIASLATAPFALYHFQQIILYGLAANMLAVPLTSFLLMPPILLAYILMPLGLEAWALEFAGWATDVLIVIARYTAAWPGARILVPAMPQIGLVLMVVGGLWLCLWRMRWRLWGLVPVLCGIATLALVQRPDVLISSDGRLVAARGTNNQLLVSSRSIGRFNAEIWARRDGVEGKPASWPRSGESGAKELRCDALGCIYHKGPYAVAIIRDAGAIDDCTDADVAISAKPLPRCSAPVVIDKWKLRKKGAHAITFTERGPKLETVGDERGNRPWSVQ